MYKLIGGDQREYGPISAEQIRQWIAEGRANGASQAQGEGMTDWKSLSSFPEFAEALAAQASALASRPPPKAQLALAATPSLDVYYARAQRLDITSCVARSWDLLKKHFWLLVGASTLILLINIALELVPVVGTIASPVLRLVLWGGLDWLFLKLIRGQAADLADAFAGFEINFLQLTLAGIVTSVLIFIGLLLCIFPGLYLIVAWLGFSPILIVDKRIDFWPALELSRQVVTRNFWTILALFLLTLLILIGGVLALGVGFFVALPLGTGAVVYAYEDIFNPPPEQNS
ncbi:MAG: DUF4339 domain-containing protein [Verrucomicrobia bacterium]|nr:DUF4339 domain-containing protein [Verrucomicrobiota bacterium]